MFFLVSHGDEAETGRSRKEPASRRQVDMADPLSGAAAPLRSTSIASRTRCEAGHRELSCEGSEDLLE